MSISFGITSPVEVPTAAEFPTFPDTFTTERVTAPEAAEGTVEAAPQPAPTSDAGAPAYLCFKVTAGSDLAQSQTGSVTWQFQAVSQ